MIGKPQGNIRGLKYRPDPTRPGGGVFVAHGKSKREDFRDLPAGTVVLSQGVSDEENEGEELEAAAEVSSSSAAAPASSSSSFVMGRRRSRTDDSVQSHSPSTESIPSTPPLLPASSVPSSSLARKRVGGSGPRSGVAGVGVGDVGMRTGAGTGAGAKSTIATTGLIHNNHNINNTNINKSSSSSSSV